MSRRRKQRVLLPWEKDSRRGFLKKGLAGAALLAFGGAGWLATRQTRRISVSGPFLVLTPEEAAVVLAIADRLVPPRSGFPRPLEVAVPRRVDELIAMAHPAVQQEVKRLLRLFENALTGMLFERQRHPFTDSPPVEQDARLASWAQSKVALRRSGYRTLKRLVFAAYYASPQTYAAVGYGGSPKLNRAANSERPAAQEPAPQPRKTRRSIAPKPQEVAPEPSEGLELPESELEIEP